MESITLIVGSMSDTDFNSYEVFVSVPHSLRPALFEYLVQGEDNGNVGLNLDRNAIHLIGLALLLSHRFERGRDQSAIAADDLNFLEISCRTESRSQDYSSLHALEA